MRSACIQNKLKDEREREKLIVPISWKRYSIRSITYVYVQRKRQKDKTNRRRKKHIKRKRENSNPFPPIATMNRYPAQKKARAQFALKCESFCARLCLGWIDGINRLHEQTFFCANTFFWYWLRRLKIRINSKLAQQHRRCLPQSNFVLVLLPDAFFSFSFCKS